MPELEEKKGSSYSTIDESDEIPPPSHLLDPLGDGKTCGDPGSKQDLKLSSEAIVAHTTRKCGEIYSTAVPDFTGKQRKGKGGVPRSIETLWPAEGAILDYSDSNWR